jgi:hypothetical protein
MHWTALTFILAAIGVAFWAGYQIGHSVGAWRALRQYVAGGHE